MKICIKSSVDVNNADIEAKIQAIIDQQEYNYYGIRKDDYEYNVDDTCYNSHSLFQDPDYDYEGNLIYPYCDSGPYEGFYDGGELDGTCAIGIYDGGVRQALRRMKTYVGDHLYLIGSDYIEEGNDTDEFVMEDATVLLQLY